MLWRGIKEDFADIPWQISNITQLVIESIGTSAKVVICSKISLNLTEFRLQIAKSQLYYFCG